MSDTVEMPDAETDVMDARTLTALRGSIEKWQAIVEGTGEDLGPHNCPLCQEFADNDLCRGCPVADAADDWGCARTPYTEWYALFADGDPQVADSTERKAAAQAELDFLISLLPEVTP